MNNTINNEAIYINAMVMDDGTKMAYIPAASLIVPSAYGKKSSKVLMLRDNWDNERCTPLQVSYRGGQFFVMDGAIRVRAGMLAGVKFFRCQIHEGYNECEEAAYFADQDKYKTFMTPLDRYKALLFAGDTMATSIQKLLDRYGLSVNPSKTPKVFTALSTAFKIYEAGDISVLDGIFSTIKSAGWEYSQRAYCSRFLRSMYIIYCRHGYNKENMRKVASFLKQFTPDVAYANAMLENPMKKPIAAMVCYIEENVFSDKISGIEENKK